MPVFGGVDSKPIIRPNAVEPNLSPEQVTLGDGSFATVFPIFSSDQIPLSLLAHMCDEFNDEIEKGQTYPLEEPLTIDSFLHYWMGDFTAIMLQGKLADFQATAAKAAEVLAETHPSAATDPLQIQLHEPVSTHTAECVKLIPSDADWDKLFLGTFHVLPNYPGRCSHVCNAGFLVSSKTRGKHIGSEMGKVYLKWAPLLGYTYSVFNLVFETNVASIKIWDNLGFDRIGRVKNAGRLKGYDEPVAAIVYGKDL